MALQVSILSPYVTSKAAKAKEALHSAREGLGSLVRNLKFPSISRRYAGLQSYAGINRMFSNPALMEMCRASPLLKVCRRVANDQNMELGQHAPEPNTDLEGGYAIELLACTLLVLCIAVAVLLIFVVKTIRSSHVAVPPSHLNYGKHSNERNGFTASDDPSLKKRSYPKGGSPSSARERAVVSPAKLRGTTSIRPWARSPTLNRRESMSPQHVDPQQRKAINSLPADSNAAMLIRRPTRSEVRAAHMIISSLNEALA